MTDPASEDRPPAALSARQRSPRTAAIAVGALTLLAAILRLVGLDH